MKILNKEVKNKLYTILFNQNTKSGRLIDIFLIFFILLSIFFVIIESVPEYLENYNLFFRIIEIIFTSIFAVEYFLRIFLNTKPSKYIFSFWGIIDLIAILPLILLILFSGLFKYFAIIRFIRMIRIFRILKLVKFNKEVYELVKAFKLSIYRIVSFLILVLYLVIILGTIMYVVEKDLQTFNSIPQSIYWAIVTITTVGYGDIVPLTPAGKLISSFVMILGYSIIAVPSGIVTVELSKSNEKRSKCNNCGHFNSLKSNYCNQCGNKLSM